uniref:ATP-dependent Clp protease proteolytic subunit n=1 Tax=Cyphia angustiloba TaxID=2041112 RepID=A0A291F2M3_9ASTR|nr:ATP-dependent protease proteolytic subunit [Cyphia angustiloba]YP_009436197.1 ATP-dependent protease proteolytic subunit [Cyphia angustiloba]ATG26329.1 ATP-dependent protease proteolytic subunit [Cyphia angustiloba]ATG26376.1 ATP-dependent protease proteolytic subunit [Cyphia angustiloba]
MPVGVPKVPYIMPVPDPESDSESDTESDPGPDPDTEYESEDKDKAKAKDKGKGKGKGKDKAREQWIELYDRLSRIRSLFLFEELSDEIANNIMGLMAFLNIDDNTQEQFLFINSPGGGMINGLGVYDMSQAVLPDVHTICVGDAISMAALILAGGAPGKRTAFPHSTIMLHQPRTSPYEGPPSEVFLDGKDMDLVRSTVEDLYVQRTGQSLSVIREHMIRDHFLTAPDALKFGLVDLVGED